MATLRATGQRLYLVASYRKDDKVRTRYLKSWPTIQEAVADLGDARTIATLRRKAKINIAKLLTDLETPGRFPSVPRHARTALQSTVGNASWDGLIEWDLGRGFWKRLTNSMIEKIGLAELSGLAAYLTFEARDAVVTFRIDVEAAARDLQRRLVSISAKAPSRNSAETSRTVLHEAMETLGLEDCPIEKLNKRDVRKRYLALGVQYIGNRLRAE